ncbi:MAG TPA: M15 family metallopeptidase [Candidatus Paceibacterota bacterium]
MRPIVIVWILGGIVMILAALMGWGAWYGYERYIALSTRVDILEADIATTTHRLQRGIDETHTTLSSALEEEQEKARKLQTQFGTISDTVDVLDKLRTLDGQLLKKYSKVYFLNENYMPEELATIPKEFTYSDNREYTIHTDVLPFLINLLEDAKEEGVELFVNSAYRSFDEQAALKGQYSVVYGAGTANQFSADQGYSEHQLGTTIDFMTTGLNGQLLQSFDATPAYVWLQQNAYRFGFILSYPKGNAYYMYEPWHWRFVGQDLARTVHRDNKNFYDLDQRDIDTYLANIFD